MEGKHGNRGFVGRPGDDRRWLNRAVWAFGIVRRCCFQHLSDETKALSLQRLDEALFLAGIADRGAGRVEASGKRRVGDDAAPPYRGNQVVLADHAFPVAYQVNKKIECLRRDRNRVGPPMQLPLVRVERKVLKQIAQSSAPDPSGRHSLARASCAKLVAGNEIVSG